MQEITGNQKIQPNEWLVIAPLGLGSMMIGTAFVTSTGIDANGKYIYPNPFQGYVIYALAFIAYAATVYFALKLFQGREGLKILAREAWPALLFGAGFGAMILGFFMRAIFLGNSFLIAILTIYALCVYLIYFFYKRKLQGK
jgi:hypothetical protein